MPDLPTIQASVHAWNLTHHRQINKRDMLHINALIPVLEYIIPSIKVLPWLSRGVSYIADIDVTHPTFNHYEAPQVRHLLKKRDIKSIAVNREVWRELQDRPYKKGGISHFYAHLQAKEESTKTAHMLAWEKDLGTPFCLKEWKHARGTTFKASRCVDHWDNFLKIANRSYLVPYRLSKIFPTGNSQCWRGCGEVGTLFHIFWTYKCLRSFWNEIFSCYLGLPVSSFPHYQKWPFFNKNW